MAEIWMQGPLLKKKTVLDECKLLDVQSSPMILRAWVATTLDCFALLPFESKLSPTKPGFAPVAFSLPLNDEVKNESVAWFEVLRRPFV